MTYKITDVAGAHKFADENGYEPVFVNISGEKWAVRKDVDGQYSWMRMRSH